jgi:CheY-like chemotaxis protein
VALRRATTVSGTKLRVLFVDDETDQLELFQRILSKYDVVTADRAEDAIALLTESQFDVIVSDNSMPGISGAEFLTRAAFIDPRPLRVMHCGVPPTDLARLEREGIVDLYVAKPGHWEIVAICREVADAAKAP